MFILYKCSNTETTENEVAKSVKHFREKCCKIAGMQMKDVCM